MPKSSTERFARTYVVRAPDDSYDSLGTTAITSLVITPVQKDTHLGLGSSFSYGSLFQVTKETGSKAGVRVGISFSKGLLQSQAIPSLKQHDNVNIGATLAGGTLKVGS